MKSINKKYSKLFSLLVLFFLPFLFGFILIINMNYSLLNVKVGVLGYILFFTLLFVLLFIFFENIYKRKYKINFRNKLGFLLISCALVCEIIGIINLVYYNDSFKNWLINSSNTSINYKSVASMVYDDKTINEYIDKEIVDVSNDYIYFDDVSFDSTIYANKYEKEILEREEGALYKVIKISGTTLGAGYHYDGYLVAVYDPSKVHLAKSSGAGTFPGSYGETLATISRKNAAVVAMNAGGFYDPLWNSNGGIPHGDVFIDGKLDSSFRRGSDYRGGIIGFTNDNRLILKNMTTEEALNANLRDAVDWGPFLIVDGVNKFPTQSYIYACARTVIGQRADGIVLFLVIDGLQPTTRGAGYNDLALIMQNYGAINAANLDGGTSTSLTINHKYVNNPWNGYQTTYRYFPNAWIVKE